MKIGDRVKLTNGWLLAWTGKEGKVIAPAVSFGDDAFVVELDDPPENATFRTVIAAECHVEVLP